MSKSKRRQRPRSAPSSPVTNREIPLKQSATPPTRSHRTSLSSAKRPSRRLIFQSPRCDLPDQAVFPAVATIWKEHEVRWKSLSAQAGSHKQDGSVLTVQPHMAPQALKLGMPRQAAARVKILKLPDCGERLPEWLDAVAPTFENLEHLYFSEEAEPEKHEDDPEESPSNSLRLRRLYILYRIPNLLSIDGRAVSPSERQFARPNHPNGQRVKREDWVEESTRVQVSTDPCPVPATPRHAVEVSLSRSATLVSSNSHMFLPSPHHAVEVDLDGSAHLRSKEGVCSPILESKEGEEKDECRAFSKGNFTPRPAVEVRLDGDDDGDNENARLFQPCLHTVELKALAKQPSLIQSPRRGVEVRPDEDAEISETPRPAVEVKYDGSAQVDPFKVKATPRPSVEVKLNPTQIEEASVPASTKVETGINEERIASDSKYGSPRLKGEKDLDFSEDARAGPGTESPANDCQLEHKDIVNAKTVNFPWDGTELDMNDDAAPLVDVDLSPNLTHQEYIESILPGDIQVQSESSNDSVSPRILPHKDSLELDRFEYVSVESSAHCDWSAACGGLSIPLFRGDNTRRLKMTAENSKSRFRLGFRRKRKPKPLDQSSQKQPASDHNEAETDSDSKLKQTALLDHEAENTQESSPKVLNLKASSSPGRPKVEIFQAAVSPPRPIPSIQVGASQLVPEQQAVETQRPGSLYSTISPLTTTSVSSPRIPASKSLTSPFPMQFRDRARTSLSPKRGLSVTTKLNSTDESPNRPSPPPVPRQRSPSLYTISTALKDPVPLVRAQSSPSKLGRRTAGELPPPCPGRRRVPSPPTIRKKKDFSKWKQHLSARTTSIIDEDEDCSSDEENLEVKET